MGRWLILIVMLLIGVGLGAGSFFAWDYISYVQPRIPGPTIGRLQYLAVQVPRMWYAYYAISQVAALLLFLNVGRFFLWKRCREIAVLRIHQRTQRTIDNQNRRIAELEMAVSDKDALLAAITDRTREYRRKLIAVATAVNSGAPVDEVAERRLLEDNSG